jgi:hypothetical protein
MNPTDPIIQKLTQSKIGQAAPGHVVGNTKMEIAEE